jgi:transposase
VLKELIGKTLQLSVAPKLDTSRELICQTTFRLLNPSLNTAYELVRDFLQMMRKREGERLDDWLRRVHESQLPELHSFAHGVEEDYEAVKAGLTLALNNGQVEGQVTKIKLIKRMMYGRAEFPLLRQRVLHAL